MTAETNNARGFAVGDRVRAIFVSAENKEFIRQGDTGTVKHIESDGDLWVKWDNPADSDQQDCGWCINADYCERLAQQPAAVDGADAKLALANDISRAFGNTNKAITDYLWSLGYRKVATPHQEPTT
jgi:hypothetical protein